MGLCNAYASSIQVELFEDLEELYDWLKETKDVEIIDIKFKSMVIINEIVFRNRVLVIYK
ncbi:MULTISPECIES: hypothetical protein [Bacillaceae]|uniref:hypothetical protein n=1 Tax=Bacillaceae TaxID=186817 RepID=UPI000A2AA398|nr:MULTISPECIES: hypothetical protein [unclassified Bacillus (in: firmicutes)]PGY09307.1 hypothetical protein COE25_18325 [Bacillus sp. AFS031507]SMQ77596.1 hypothetical protein SAMN05444673_2939 [Bacillus sp. OV166]